MITEKANYSSDFIHCVCGENFYVDLEDSLSSEISSDSFEDSISDTSNYICSSCKREYSLEIKLTKIIEVDYAKLQPIGKRLEANDGTSFSANVFDGKWVGEEVYSVEKSYYYGETKTPIPDGVYFTDVYEYHVKDGIITNIWGMPDENQLSLFEECIV